MLALKEFANFISLNVANLAATYDRLLAEKDEAYQALPPDTRVASARRLIKAVAEACELGTPESLHRLFDLRKGFPPSENNKLLQPFLEIECLGQTLTPVVTNLEAGKFLWHMLAEVRARLLPALVQASVALTPEPANLTGNEEINVSRFEEQYQGSIAAHLPQEILSEGQHLRLLIDNVPDYIYAKDADGRFILANLATVRLLGASRMEEVIGKTDFDFFPPELASQFRADEQALMQSGQPLLNHEERLVDIVTGQTRWNLTSKIPLQNPQGQAIGLIGINRDITRRKQAEEALQDSAERYYSLFENSPISLWEEDFSAVKTYIDRLRQEGVEDFRAYFESHPEVVAQCALMVRIIDVNQTTLEMYQAKSKEEFFAGLGQVFTEESFVAFREELIAIAEGKTRIEIEAINSTLQGDKKYLTLNWAVAPGYEETLAKVFVSIIDITERKQVQRALEESEKRYYSLFADSPISLWEEDFSAVKTYVDSLRQEGVEDFRAYFESHPEIVAQCAAMVKIVDVNQFTLELYQAKSKEEFFAGLDQVFSEESFSAFREELITLAEGRTRFEGETINYTLTGDKKHIVLRAFVAPGFEETLSKVFIAIIDITELKQLEQQIRESLERRSRQVQTATEIAQAIAAVAALDDLFQRVVNLVQERFGYYHAQIYILEEDQLVMQEGTGEAGRQMKEAGHKIPLLSEKSLVARAAWSGEPVLVPDVFQEPTWLPNPLLPRTRAEIAVPIQLGAEIIGVLDVQSDTIGGVDEEDQLMLMGLCGQIAVAIDNRRVEIERRQAEERLVEERNLLRAVIDSVPDLIYVKDTESRFLLVNIASTPHGDLTKPEDFVGKTDFDLSPPELAAQYYADEQAIMRSGQAVIGREELNISPDGQHRWFSTTKTPLRDRQGKIIGIIGVSRDITKLKQTQAEIEQLLAEAERRVRREQAIREITEKMRAASSLEGLVKITARELGQRLSAGHTIVELGIDAPLEPAQPASNGHDPEGRGG